MLGNNDDDSNRNELETLKAEEETNGNNLSDLSGMISDISERADLFVNRILLVLAPPPPPSHNNNQTDTSLSSVPEKEPTTTNHLEELPSRVFRYVLRAYLSTPSDSRRRLVATILLPTLCEKCSQEQLLFGDGQNSLGLLVLIREVLSEVIVVADSSTVVDDGQRNDEGHKDILMSVASIVMSMLIAVLELGSKQRSAEEEETLRSFLPILQDMSDPSRDVPEMAAAERSAMADMASYAMTMIASRNILQEKDQENKESHSSSNLLSTEDKLRKILNEAENDLKSTQPPLRARGMVSLGRLARGFTGSIEIERAPSIIEELDENGNSLDHDEKTFLIKEIVRLAAAALSDEESYVYLAAIQTIVAVGDLYPKHVLPLIASGVVSGNLSIATKQSPENTIELSQEQRIKMAEALIFIIRRRAVTDEYIPSLIQTMLYSNSQSGRIGSSHCGAGANNQDLIQRETTKYFLGDEDDTEETSKKEKMEEQDVRLRTGGPIFDSEEADVVRSVRISVVAELLCNSSSSVMAPHCKLLVPLVVDAMSLDSSRLVTRAAALLAREMYNCFLREADRLEASVAESTIDRSSSNALTIPFSTEMVSSGEDRMLIALREYIERSSAASINDTATSVRCQEAIELRQEAEEKGIVLAAKLVLADAEAWDRLPEILKISKEPKLSIKVVDPIDSLE